MNPDLQAKLVTYLDGLEKGAAKVGEFAEREIPETIREWLMWLAIERFTYAALFLVGSVAAWLLIRWFARLSYREWEKYIDDWKQLTGQKPQYRYLDHTHWNGWLFLTIVQWAAAILLSIGTVTWGLQATKVIVSPRVVIVEKVAELAKGGAK